MRQRFLELIAREVEHLRAGRPARIIAKMNQLEDPAVIAALCEASRAGVPIDLIVRGLCCLRPGIEGFTESIRIRRSSAGSSSTRGSSISRLAASIRRGDFFIGSADWMFRNLSNRLEVVAPVTARSPRERLWRSSTCRSGISVRRG